MGTLPRGLQVSLGGMLEKVSLGYIYTTDVVVILRLSCLHWYSLQVFPGCVCASVCCGFTCG